MGSPTEDEKIGPTAHYTAYVWHRLGFDHAHLFVTPLGRTLFWGFRLAGEGALTWVPSVPSMTQYLELRHRSFEAVLSDEQPDVVVELGAGLSRRGVTWASRGVRYVEVDLPAMVALKKRLLAERASPALRSAIGDRLTHVSIDILREGFADDLAELLAGAERPLVMAEGVLGYFALPDRERLARSVATALAGRGPFVAELRIRSQGGGMSAAIAVLRAGIRIATRGRGTREDAASPEEVRALFERAGFERAEPLPRERLPDLAGVPAPIRIWLAR